MIYISKEQLSQVEYLIDQSIQGNHVLFDLDTLRRVFWNESPHSYSRDVSKEDAYSVEHHIEQLMQEPTLAQKKAYLEQLDQGTFERVVKTYFNIVENNLMENQEVRH